MVRLAESEWEQMEYFVMRMAFLKPERPDVGELKELAGQFLRMLCQKTAGQESYAKTGDIRIEGNFERVRMGLLNNGIRLARSGMLDQADLIGDMPALPVADKRRMKDRDRDEASIRETFWGRAVDGAGFRRLVDELENHDSEALRRAVVLETVLIVLSGRLETV